jgi:hypothetical protein
MNKFSIPALIGIAVMCASTAGLTEGQPSYKSLLDQGFEIKDTMFLNADVSSRLSGGGSQPDTVLVTLQKGTITATCWIVLAGWNLQKGVGKLPCNVLD